jgi:glycosyltransferase involved in cell wall biosynthesis
MVETLPLADRDIVCFANDWTGDPLSKQHIMRRLAHANRVLWVNSLGNRRPSATARDVRRVFGKAWAFLKGLRQVEPNLHVLAPLAIPSYGSAAVATVNRALVRSEVRAAMASLRMRRPVLYTFVPASAWVVGALDETVVVYHVADEYSAFNGAGEAIATLDRRLCRSADLVIACSQPLLIAKRPLSRRAILVRHGVDHSHFARALEPSMPIPDDVASLPRPILGFHGLIAEWVDLDLVRAVADAFPRGSVVLIGDLTRDSTPLTGARNVHLLGRRPYASLPGYCKAFDVALLPFAPGPLTEAANPLKLREYLAAGLPVVATSITEARALEARGVRVADSTRGAQGFIDAIVAELAASGPRIERSRAVAGETWDAKVAEIAQAIAALPDRPA